MDVSTGRPHRPSEHPDRTEVVTCNHMRRTGEKMLAMADILRHPDGSYPGLGEINITEPFGVGMMDSLFEAGDAQAIPRNERRRMRRDLMRFAVPVERLKAH